MSEQKRIPFPPRPGVLVGWSLQYLTIKQVFREPIDNAGDQGAGKIDFSFGLATGSRAVYLTIEDDGDGCPDLSLFLRYGDHGGTRRKGGRLGRYGCGLKDVALWAGGIDSTMQVRSIHDGKERRLTVNWGDQARTTDWSVPADAFEGPFDAKPGERGTRITIAPFTRKIPEGQAYSDLLEDLGYHYTPLLNKGTIITVRNKTKGSPAVALKPWKLPELEPGFVNCEITVDGRTAWVHVGMVGPNTPNSRPGITYFYDYRVIEAASSNGCGDFGRARIAGWVRLGAGWALNKNKDGFSKSDDLYDAVYEVCKPLLEKAAAAAQILESTALLEKVSADLNVRLGLSPGGTADPKARARRGKGDKSGTKEPTGEGGKHERAKNEQTGDTFHGRGKRGRLKIEAQPLSDSAGIGTYDGRWSIVLASNHPAVEAMLKSSDQTAIRVLAISLVAMHSALPKSDPNRQGQNALPYNGSYESNFSQFIAAVMRDVTSGGAKVFQLPARKAIGE